MIKGQGSRWFRAELRVKGLLGLGWRLGVQDVHAWRVRGTLVSRLMRGIFGFVIRLSHRLYVACSC